MIGLLSDMYLLVGYDCLTGGFEPPLPIRNVQCNWVMRTEGISDTSMRVGNGLQSVDHEELFTFNCKCIWSNAKLIAGRVERVNNAILEACSRSYGSCI